MLYDDTHPHPVGRVSGYIFCTLPSCASSLTRSPVLSRFVACLTLASAGRPYSRAMVDACDSTPPTSTMTPGRERKQRRPGRVRRRRDKDGATLHAAEVAGIADDHDFRFDTASAHRRPVNSSSLPTRRSHRPSGLAPEAPMRASAAACCNRALPFSSPTARRQSAEPSPV